MNGLKRRTNEWRQWLLAAALAAVLGLGSANVEALGQQSAAQANAAVTGERYLIPGGKSVGIAIETEGLVVVGTSDLGVSASPARLAGLTSGDIITQINDQQVRTSQELATLLKAGEAAALRVMRGDEEKTLTLIPATDPRDGTARIGAWVRSSTAGVGTLTYVDPDNGEFAALGHAISDIDTGITLPVAEGGLYDSRIVQINRSEKGMPGEIVGDFLNETEAIGEVTLNCASGVFGEDYSGDTGELLYPDGLPVGGREQTHTGRAQLLTTLDDEVRAFDCEIERIEPKGRQDNRSLVVRITDEQLLSRTGGIVQGMSGSPIIQNGKLVGAVTHVLVNDPTRGYGIFIENMLDAAG